jgi:hypothetical protein
LLHHANFKQTPHRNGNYIKLIIMEFIIAGGTILIAALIVRGVLKRVFKD